VATRAWPCSFPLYRTPTPSSSSCCDPRGLCSHNARLVLFTQPASSCVFSSLSYPHLASLNHLLRHSASSRTAMSSWPASVYPPPPRRSRSRSPGYRAGSVGGGGGAGGYYGRPSYPGPDSGGHDMYRTDWEAYDRDRAWATYERDRAAYDYHRRRSRSPGDDGTSSLCVYRR
jgi:hypothetical protein